MGRWDPGPGARATERADAVNGTAAASRKRHHWDQQITYALKHRSCLACGVTASTFGVGSGRTWSYKAADGTPLGTRSPSCPPAGQQA